MLGAKQEWEEAASGVRLGKQIKGVCLWMDSTDLCLIGKSSTSRKEHTWSYKCNSPGRRYMMLCDGKGIVRKLWGGDSPKVYDGHFVEERTRWFEKKLKGTTVVADQHFEWAKKNLKHVCFHTPISAPKGRPKKEDKKGTNQRKERD